MPARPVLLIAGGARSLQAVYAQFMGQRGYSTRCVDTGKSVLEWLERADRPIDILLVDQEMPGMRDAHLLRHMRQLRHSVPVLLVTDAAARGAALAAQDRWGVARVLSKPVTAEALLEATSSVHSPPPALSDPPSQPESSIVKVLPCPSQHN